jgi:hypothetical protein
MAPRKRYREDTPEIEVEDGKVRIFQSFSIKDHLKSLGFRFSSDDKAWWMDSRRCCLGLGVARGSDITLDLILAASPRDFAQGGYQPSRIPSSQGFSQDGGGSQGGSQGANDPYVGVDGGKVLVFNSFQIKDKLKALGFRWDPTNLAWWKQEIAVLKGLGLDDPNAITADLLCQQDPGAFNAMANAPVTRQEAEFMAAKLASEGHGLLDGEEAVIYAMADTLKTAEFQGRHFGEGPGAREIQHQIFQNLNRMRKAKRKRQRRGWGGGDYDSDGGYDDDDGDNWSGTDGDDDPEEEGKLLLNRNKDTMVTREIEIWAREMAVRTREAQLHEREARITAREHRMLGDVMQSATKQAEIEVREACIADRATLVAEFSEWARKERALHESRVLLLDARESELGHREAKEKAREESRAACVERLQALLAAVCDGSCWCGAESALWIEIQKSALLKKQDGLGAKE